ncbi:MAG: hypothetical protein AB1430_20755 [Pseudomonadota bacterium]
MKPLSPLFAIALGLAALAASAADTDQNAAAQRCEESVSSTLQRVRGKAVQDVQFIGAKRALTVDGDDIGVKGEGLYRRAGASVPFTYSCAVNLKTGATSGVVFKEAPEALAEQSKPWQPDLTNMSPEACEATVAALLKDKHPRVDGIAFLSDTRQLKPAGGALMSLEGQGTLKRAPGMNPNAFRYRCDLDPRNGKVVAARATD